MEHEYQPDIILTMMLGRDRRSAGFTLIELLIVLFIISIVTSVALLTIRQNENRQLESFANEMAQIITLAREQAMLQPAVLGLLLKEDSYEFVVYKAPAVGKKETWVPLDDKWVGTHSIPSHIQVSIKAKGQQAGPSNDEDETYTAVPQIVISTNGDMTPFTIYVGKRGQGPRYVIRGEADGNVTSKLLP